MGVSLFGSTGTGYTLAELKQAIQDYTDNDETVFVNNLNNFIAAAEERILNEVPLEFFRKNASANMTATSQYFAKPSDWLFSLSMNITDSNGDKKFLLNKDKNFVQEYWPDPSAQGEPKYYADYNVSTFIVAPTPNTGYTAEIEYVYRPQSLVNTSTGTTWLSENAGPALLYGCLVEAYTFMKGEPDMIQTYEQSYERTIARLKVFAEAAEGRDFYRRSKD